MEEELKPEERTELIADIASRQYTAKTLGYMYELSTESLRSFTHDNLPAIERERERIDRGETDAQRSDVVTPTELAELWISNKFARLKRYESVADQLYGDIIKNNLSGAEISTALRELRSYMLAAANELGQLLHRGSGESGDGDMLGVDIQGVDMDRLR